MAGSLRRIGAAVVVSAASLFGCQGCSPAPVAPPTAGTKPAPGEPPVVTLTPKAAAVVRGQMDELANGTKLYLRLRVEPGGCQGFMHKLDLDPVVSPDDQVCETAGVPLVVAKCQSEMLRGAEVDFGEENGRQGFKVENPNFKGESAKKWLAVLEKEKKAE